MSAPVDVLAVMDCVIAGEREWGAHEAANALTNARAAVAELIDAVDELSKFSNKTDWDDLSDGTAEMTRALWTRVNKALTRAGGAA
ncbi:hypothetical protein [Xanthomonas arboricola]|uniref:hypothetical protein n=1 Tax=Xanthomonas arboricola TaxID=56448 RepID=UPI001431EA88|nr:hypothetical protein [Xanthomonas arboricola]NJB80334.1 hypothetical protein [Xanthomonas arboricola]